MNDERPQVERLVDCLRQIDQTDPPPTVRQTGKIVIEFGLAANSSGISTNERLLSRLDGLFPKWIQVAPGSFGGRIIVSEIGQQLLGRVDSESEARET
jgi:hypothetical protein